MCSSNSSAGSLVMSRIIFKSSHKRFLRASLESLERARDLISTHTHTQRRKQASFARISSYPYNGRLDLLGKFILQYICIVYLSIVILEQEFRLSQIIIFSIRREQNFHLPSYLSSLSHFQMVPLLIL